MKKKFKLFATIGSLALAVCMMTIGVLAASQVTLNVTSNVSFNTTSVLVDIAGSVTGAVEGQNDYDGFTANPADPSTTPTAWAIGALTFDETHKTITYKITVTNQSEFAVKMAVTGAPSATPQLGVQENNTGSTSIEPEDQGVYTLTLTLKDFSTSMSAVNVTLNVTITAAA